MFDDATIDIPCPGCGHKTEQSVRWLKAHDEMTCAGCGATVALDRDELLAGLKKSQKALAKFRASLGKFGKRR